MASILRDRHVSKQPATYFDMFVLKEMEGPAAEDRWCVLRVTVEHSCLAWLVHEVRQSHRSHMIYAAAKSMVQLELVRCAYQAACEDAYRSSIVRNACGHKGAGRITVLVDDIYGISAHPILIWLRPIQVLIIERMLISELERRNPSILLAPHKLLQNLALFF